MGSNARHDQQNDVGRSDAQRNPQDFLSTRATVRMRMHCC
jgi:hypothetical protein